MESTVLTPPPDGDVILSNHFIAGIVAMTILAVLIAWLRMYTRIFVSHNTGWDDWTMFAASIVTVVTDGFLMNSYHYGLGRHLYYLKPDQVSQTFKWLWAAEPTNLFAVFLVRLSISLFFLRLIPPKKTYLWVIRGTIAALVVSDVFVSITYFFECTPIRKVWEPTTPGTCLSPGVSAAAVWLYQAVSILADIILLIIPVHLFWGLQMQMRTKIFLTLLCCLGVFTCACAVVKTALLVKLFSLNPDKTWIIAQLCLWAPMELCVGMICGTIPTLRPLIASKSKRSQEQGYYERYQLPHKLTSTGNELPLIPSIFSASKPKVPHLSRSASRERIVETHNLQTIRRTFEVQVDSESARGASEGRQSHRNDWNHV